MMEHDSWVTYFGIELSLGMQICELVDAPKVAVSVATRTTTTVRSEPILGHGRTVYQAPGRIETHLLYQVHLYLYAIPVPVSSFVLERSRTTLVENLSPT